MTISDYFSPIPAINASEEKCLKALLGGNRLIDLLFHFPVNLIISPLCPAIDQAIIGEEALLKITIIDHKVTIGKGRPYRIIVGDDTAQMTITYFNSGSWLRRLYPIGESRVVLGKITGDYGHWQMNHPYYVAKDMPELPLLRLIYPLTTGLKLARLTKIMWDNIAKLEPVPEWLGNDWRQERGWPLWHEAIIQVHTASDIKGLDASHPARQRLAFDELLAHQIVLRILRRQLTAKTVKRADVIRYFLTTDLMKLLPYELTKGQIAALDEIMQDMTQEKPMLRLLQGDVGSGKTIVALFALLHAIENGYQTCLMVPTMLLAGQHLATITQLTMSLGIKTAILTAASKNRTQVLTKLADGEIDLLIGTHAILEDDVYFKNLGFVVIDEQHRFGVDQRLTLAMKAYDHGLDILVMSATPIPRTLTLTAFGDMDVSRLNYSPFGRLPIDTRIMPLRKIDELIAGLQRKINEGVQIYWVCPLVEDKNGIDGINDISSVTTRKVFLDENFGKENIGLVHGRLSAKDKTEALSDFNAAKTKILVATTVIEVGIDVANAAIIVIENAERFGLAALHQLRGRVGRSCRQSYCFLLYGSDITPLGRQRLDILRSQNNGFIIAEHDLKLRGGGDLRGTKQSGLPQYKITDISQHYELITLAHNYARKIMDKQQKPGREIQLLLKLFDCDIDVNHWNLG